MASLRLALVEDYEAPINLRSELRGAAHRRSSNLRPAQAAAQEAYEEAGLIGQIVGKRPIGTYHYAKRTKPSDVLCEVRVYLLRVEKQLQDWPESQQRVRAWFDAAKAAELVDEGALALIIASFAGTSLV